MGPENSGGQFVAYMDGDGDPVEIVQPMAEITPDYSAGGVSAEDTAEAVEYWLDNETDFFKAPASSKNHLAQPGGLVVHSLNVWRRLREITVRDLTDRDAPGEHHLSKAEEETVAILGLLHDVCKVGVYHQTDQFKAATEGKLDTMATYEFRDPLPLGHGEKSLFLINRHMALTEEEAMAIRWHMGAYDDAVKGGSRDGNKRRSAEIVANSVNFGDSKPKEQAAPASDYAAVGAYSGGYGAGGQEASGDLPF